MVDQARVDRLNSLSELDREQLRRTVGDAALDLWCIGVTWPDLVERCLQAIEEDAAVGRVPIRH